MVVAEAVSAAKFYGYDDDALYQIADSRKTKLVELLLAWNANVAFNENAALHDAVNREEVHIVQMLLDKDATPSEMHRAHCTNRDILRLLDTFDKDKQVASRDQRM